MDTNAITESKEQSGENWTVSFMMNSQKMYFVEKGNYTNDLHHAMQFTNWSLANEASEYLNEQGYHADIDLIDATIFQ